MCYSVTVDQVKANAKAAKAAPTVAAMFGQQGDVARFYARKSCPVISIDNGDTFLSAMHWDLIPSWFLNGDNLTVDEVIKKKNAKVTGFTSFNARVESIESKPAYRNAWREGRRCIFPAISFLEWPNRKDRPADFRMKEYEIELLTDTAIAGLYDIWTAKDGMQLISCTMITANGLGHPVMDSIYHNRIPLILADPMACLREGKLDQADHDTIKLKQSSSEG